MAEKKAYLLRIDEHVLDDLQKWAADELRSVNAQIEWVLRRALQDAGRATRIGEASPRRRYGRDRLGARSRSG
jgi:hypothetical protein